MCCIEGKRALRALGGQGFLSKHFFLLAGDKLIQTIDATELQNCVAHGGFERALPSGPLGEPSTVTVGGASIAIGRTTPKPSRHCSKPFVGRRRPTTASHGAC